MQTGGGEANNVPAFGLMYSEFGRDEINSGVGSFGVGVYVVGVGVGVNVNVI